MLLSFDLRTRTVLVCGALALAIAASALLRGRVRPIQLYFAGFGGAMGLWYLSQAFFGFFQASIWERGTALVAVLVPQFALHLFEAMVPHSPGTRSRLLRVSQALGVVVLGLVLFPFEEFAFVRVVVFCYVFVLITAGLYQLGQRGKSSPSRATQRRVQLLVIIGALAGLATIVDFIWFLGARTPPVGAALSIVFLFVLAQALRHERLLDIYEVFSRLLVATAVAFLIAGIFYVLLTFIGGFNTMYLNAVLAATVILVLFEPLQARVEEQMQRLFFRERTTLERIATDLRRRLSHTVEIEEMAQLVIGALEGWRSATSAAFYLRDPEATGYDCRASFGGHVPSRIEVATARALLEYLESTPSVSLEAVEDELRERRGRGERTEVHEAVIAAAEVLGAFRQGVALAVRAEDGDIVGLLLLADDRVRDFIAPEETSVLEQVAAQMGVVIENSRVYSQLQEKDRLAMIGQMAAGLAHEIRNPLGAIKGAAQLLSDPAAGDVDPQSREFLGIILEEVERLDRVVGSVLDLARPNPAVSHPTDVNAAIRRSLQVFLAEPENEDLTIDTVLDPELARAGIDPELLRQVFLNLVQNARQAMRGRGKITVTTRMRFGRGTRSSSGTPDPFVEVNVADTGPGIADKLLAKIFLPFFTTKDKGTGLGLAISQRIVQGVGGRIEVKSYEGRGSTFTVVLPVVEARSTTPPPVEVEELSMPAREGADGKASA